MVDISAKEVTRRTATASGFIRLQPATLDLIERHAASKGDVLAVARVAAIQAAKLTSSLIPLCHHLPLSSVTIDFATHPDGITVTTTAHTSAQTGVEMEALTAVAVATLTLYDMLKSADSSMVIENIRLEHKTR